MYSDKPARGSATSSLVQIAIPGAFTPLPPRGKPRASARADVSPRVRGEHDENQGRAREEAVLLQSRERERPVPRAVQPLPMTRDEMLARGWNEVDVVIVTADAYIDHPSFAMAILGRVLEAYGYRVAILAQPDWRSCEPWKTFGRPRLFFAISAGNMDSMINLYTANRKVRNDDAYSPGGKIGLRPERATLPYCHRAREAYKGVPIIAGGVEASLRRLAHYDYWSDTVKRSILLDSKADLVVFGMGESAIVEIAQRLDRALECQKRVEPVSSRSNDGLKARLTPSPFTEALRDLRNMRGVAYALPASEQPPDGLSESPLGEGGPSQPSTPPGTGGAMGMSHSRAMVVTLPSFEEVKADKYAFAESTRLIHLETNPYNARTLVQWHDTQAVVCNPPRLPESQEAMDFYYGLPYTRKPHPSYREPIPAFQVVKDSVTIMRGCFGGCVYCSITTHQGRIIQSRSKRSIVDEVARLGCDPEFKGTVSDIGGPTANMYEMRCLKPEVEAVCRRLSCVHPTVCKLLGTDHGPLIEVMRESRRQKGVKKVLVASGVRMDLAQLSPEYMHELTAHHVGGHLKVAPEHTDDHTLHVMKRPTLDNFNRFANIFRDESKKVGKKQYLVPYFISAHPGSDLNAMIDLAVFLKEQGYRPEQVQDFIPAPFDIAACMYHTGLDPFTKKEVPIARHLRDRKLQRALLQFFKPENYFTVRKALIQAGRQDLIGDGCHALISSRPPKEALADRRRRAHLEARDGDHVHSRQRMPNGGYRPKRTTQHRRAT